MFPEADAQRLLNTSCFFFFFFYKDDICNKKNKKKLEKQTYMQRNLGKDSVYLLK